MDLDAALRDLSDALGAGEHARNRDARLRGARSVVMDRCRAALGARPGGPESLADLLRAAAVAPDRTVRRGCAALLVHALAIPGLVPSAASGTACALAETGLRDVLVRCGYPFGASVEARMQMLERLHSNLAELMEPLEPTFPVGIQGLYAG